MNRRVRLIETLFIAVALGVSLVWAQDHDAIVRELAEKRNVHALDVLTSELNLSPDQRSQVKAALSDRTNKLLALEKEMADRKKSISSETDSRITSQLTEDQKAKYADVKAELEKPDGASPQRLEMGGTGGGRHGGRHGGMGGF